MVVFVVTLLTVSLTSDLLNQALIPLTITLCLCSALFFFLVPPEKNLSVKRQQLMHCSLFRVVPLTAAAPVKVVSCNGVELLFFLFIFFYQNKGRLLQHHRPRPCQQPVLNLDGGDSAVSTFKKWSSFRAEKFSSKLQPCYDDFLFFNHSGAGEMNQCWFNENIFIFFYYPRSFLPQRNSPKLQKLLK